MAARATPHQSTGVSPFTLITGRNMTLPLHLLYQPGDLNHVTAYNTHQYLEELHQHLRMTFAFAQLQRSTESRKAYYDRKASHHELNVGDKVWYYSFARPRQTGKGGRLNPLTQTTICSTPHRHKYCRFRKTYSNLA